jgi:MerR family mercuric resistance operon transcriptional regulator
VNPVVSFRATVDVVRFVKHAQQLGFALDDVDHAAPVRSGLDDCDAVSALATTKIEDVTAKIRRLGGIYTALTRLVDTSQRPRTGRECPLLAAELR